MAPQPRDLVVVGASAGGVEALRAFVSGIPAQLPAAVAMVLHVPPNGSSSLPALLDVSGSLRCVRAYDGQPLRPGWIHIAPPNHHLVVDDDVVRLSAEPEVNGYRPSVDVLFRSAAKHGRRVIGVVLSGALDDGAEGMVAIKAGGGLTVVQDPREARCPGMPRSVLERVEVDHVVRASAMGALLAAETGHAVTGDPDVERALWTALRALEEKATLARQIRDSARGGGRGLAAERFERTEEESTAAAQVLRTYLTRAQPVAEAER